MSPIQVSVVMPALNEEKNLPGAVRNIFHSFVDLGISGEVIIVNDGSRDRTGEIARSLQAEFSSIQILDHARPGGIGAAFWDGAALARGFAITMLPGDGENDAREILRYLPLLRDVDVVIPFAFNHEVRSLRRRLISKTYKGIINLTFGILLNYMNGTVMYRREALGSLTLKSKGFFYQTELLIRAIRKGYLYAEVPYALKKRAGGKSKALNMESFLKLSRDYLAILWSVHTDRELALGRGLHPETVTAQRKKEILQSRL